MLKPLRLWSWLTVTFALLLSTVRLSVIDWSAPLVPYWDEWTATAEFILKPWHKGQVPWTKLWVPHNDHRIVLTRLWEMSWFSLLGEWDPTVVATANALLLSGVEAAFVIWIARAWPVRRRVAWLWAGVALLVVPYGYETLLISFQSQFHFLVVLGLTAIVAATHLEDSRWGAFVAIFASALALFTVGAGPLVSVTVGFLAALQSIVRRRLQRRTAVVLACSVAIFAVGWTIRAPATFVPGTPAQTTLAAMRYAGWPASNLANLVIGWPESSRYLPSRLKAWPSPEKPAIQVVASFVQSRPALTGTAFAAIALITYLPVILLLVHLLSVREPAPHPAVWALVGTAAWCALNVLGMAVARSGDLLVPPRYQDLLVLGLLANAGALLALVQFPSVTKRTTGWLIPLWASLTGAALGITALGVVAVQLPRKAAESVGARKTVQAYVASGNPELFRNRPPNFVPWPSGENDLAKLLLDSDVRAVLPVELRAQPVQPSIPGRMIRGLLWIAPGLGALAALLCCLLTYQLWRESAAVSASFNSPKNV